MSKEKYHIYETELHDARGTWYYVADKWGKYSSPYLKGPKGLKKCQELLKELNSPTKPQ